MHTFLNPFINGSVFNSFNDINKIIDYFLKRNQ